MLTRRENKKGHSGLPAKLTAGRAFLAVPSRRVVPLARILRGPPRRVPVLAARGLMRARESSVLSAVRNKRRGPKSSSPSGCSYVRACAKEGLGAHARRQGSAFRCESANHRQMSFRRPIIRLPDGTYLALQIRGYQTEEDRGKHTAAHRWAHAVNRAGRRGRRWDDRGPSHGARRQRVPA